MSFKGLVTRKDEDTGVSLLAKIVTPNKKKSTKKTFAVKVKANALSDFECCVIDLATARSKILNGVDTTNVKTDVPMSYYGENGTTLSYNIINVDSGNSQLSDYLKSDGKISGRPKYGEGDAIGFVEITASKNAAKTSTRISITIKETSATEVLYDGTYFTAAAVWNIIRGTNSAYSNDSSSGHRNIKADLNLPETYVCSALTDTPINLSYSIKGGEIQVNGQKITRMSAAGKYGSVPYVDACTLVGVSYGAVVSGTPNLRNVIISELVVTVNLTLNGATRKFEFNCATQSERITNEEVLTALTNGIFKYYTSTDGSNRISHPFGSSISSSTPDYTFSGVDEGHGEITVPNCNNGGYGANTIAIPSLKLSESEVLLETSYEIKAINGTSAYDDAMINQAFNGGVFVSNGDNTQSTLKFNYDDFYKADASKRQFSIACKIAIKSYGGDQLKGTRTVYARFAVSVSGMTDPSSRQDTTQSPQ